MRVTKVGVGVLLCLSGPVASWGEDPAGSSADRPPDAASSSEPRPFTLRADLGGPEPGTSRQAFEAVVAHRGTEPWEWQVGYSYTDQVYYRSNRGFLTLYRFFNDGLSYVKADATLRKYDYPVDATVQRPNPDSSAYEWVPRGELEVSHWLLAGVRAGVQYQLFPANFFYDTSSWTVNQKVAGELELWPVRSIHFGLRAALLRDPDPDKTEILGRPVPGAPAGTVAAATNVVYQTQSLVGGWGEIALAGVGLKLEYLPNRDLDSSYDWSLLTTLELRPVPSLDVRLQQVHDTYSSASNFAGATADIYMGSVAYRMSEALRLRAGYRYVDAPNRTGGTLIAGVEWRTGLP
jgi:hypothetical protein